MKTLVAMLLHAVRSAITLASDLLFVGGKTVGLLILLLVGLSLLLGPALLFGALILVAYVIATPFGGVYRYALLRKYLRSRLPPLFAGVAVTLCTAMVIIVISIMGGFLEMMRGAVRSLSGDVIVSSDLNGFGPYEPILEGIRQLPEVAAATPAVRSFGLLTIQGQVKPVEVQGVFPEELDAVLKRQKRPGSAAPNGFRESLHWGNADLLEELEDHERSAGAREQMTPDERGFFEQRRREIESRDFRDYGMRMEPPEEWEELPGMVPGVALAPYNYRDKKGKYDFRQSAVGTETILTILRISEAGVPTDPAVQRFVVVNEFKSGLHDIDANRVFVPFALLQEKLGMHRQRVVDEETGELTDQYQPARVNEIVVRAAEGVSADRARDAVDAFLIDFIRHNPTVGAINHAETWRQQHSMFLGAVEKEKLLLTFLFAIISLVAFVMILVIFYSIVLEKTRDIGTLRALGASRTGVASIFVGYGLGIGIIGALVGLAMAAAIVWHVNEIQDFLGGSLGVALFYLATALGGLLLGTAASAIGMRGKHPGRWVLVSVPLGVLVAVGGAFAMLAGWPGLAETLNEKLGIIIWTPEIYYFDRLPDRLDPREVGMIIAFAIVGSLVGSLLPAFQASRLDPVEALRYE